MAQEKDGKKTEGGKKAENRTGLVIAIVTTVGVLGAAAIGILPQLIDKIGTHEKNNCASVPEWLTSGGSWAFYGDGGLARFQGRYVGKLHETLAFPGKPRFRGALKSTVNVPNPTPTCRVDFVFGYDPKTGDYLAAGFGGQSAEYSIREYREGRGWRTLAERGRGVEQTSSLQREMRLVLSDGSANLFVNDAAILEAPVGKLNISRGIGLRTESCGVIEFICTETCSE